MNRKIITILLTLALLAALPVSAHANILAPDSASAASTASDEAEPTRAERIAELTNAERTARGLEPLEIDEELMAAAQIRAEECALLNSIYVNGQAHTRPDGSKWFTVLGVDVNLNYGENCNSGSGERAPETILNSWMNSDGHRANILYEEYTAIGVGSAISAEGSTYSVQIFYRP